MIENQKEGRIVEQENITNAGSVLEKNTMRPLVLAGVSCFVLTAVILTGMMSHVGLRTYPKTEDTDIRAKLERHMEDLTGSALSEDTLAGRQEQTYRLSDSDLTAPEPDPACFGETGDPKEMQGVLEEASQILDGQDTLFSAETVIMEGSSIRYYLDETIFAVSWKQPVDGCVYTFSEVKIAHASQFRRFYSEGKYGSGILRTTTEMSESVNAVVASSGDYYGFRSYGVIVNNGQVHRAQRKLLDTCYIDVNGDMLFTYAEETGDEETMQKFVDENRVRFSISFGPVMIREGQVCVPARYNSGEINTEYARAALCQMDTLHYVVVTANAEEPYYSLPKVRQFAEQLCAMGIPTAYALDGGQTAAIVMNNTLINKVSYGAEREISDIIYFATAVPAEREEEIT